MRTGWSRFVGKLVSPDKPRSALTRYGLAATLPFVSLGLTQYFFGFERGPFFPLFMLGILGVAVYGGIRPGLVAGLISIALNGVVLPPSFSLRISNPGDLLRLLTFALVAFLLVMLTGTIGELQRKIEFERERLHVTLTSIGDAVIGTDVGGRVTFMNAVAEEATGWNFAESLGKPLEAIFHIVNEKTGAGVVSPAKTVLETGKISGLANHTLLIRRDGSEIPIDDSAAPIRSLAGEMVGAVLIFRNISQQRVADTALIRAEKLASVGRLASTIAHEINNPLEAISNLLFLINVSPDLDTARVYGQTAQQQLGRIAHVTRQTLSFTKPDGRRESLALGAVAAEVLSLYEEKVRTKHVQVLTEYSRDAVAEVNSTELRQVIANLVSNALDAVPSRGRLHVRVRAARWGARSTARLVIADSGEGISQKHLDKIFEPFFTTKKDVGTGLGLWVTKQIVDAHAGCIHVRSRVGRGTVIAVCWPVGSKGAEDISAVAG